MGTQSTVYGRITVDKDFDKVKTYFKSIQPDNSFPFITPEMFNVGSTSTPLFYDELIITFGATYKAVEDCWVDFIVKFERILEKIEFVTAVIHLETEFMGTYCFFWKYKMPNDNFNSDYRLIETPKWFFGVGNRDMWGQLLDLLDNKHDYPFGFSYPVQANPAF